jgi:hypothetical protein
MRTRPGTAFAGARAAEDLESVKADLTTALGL